MKKGIISVLLFITVVLLASAQNKQKNLYDFTMLLQNAGSLPNTNFFRNSTMNIRTRASLLLDSRRITSRIRNPVPTKR
jgi:hypothetical protein